ncbi:MAG: hypothetical protein L0Y70_29385 [Gemmataceae bacterium]|nr:hypothetical protein [Gemmataceae bacterium]
MPHLRKRIYVDAEVQGALIRRVIVHWAAFAAALAVILGAVQFFTNPLGSFDEHLALFPRRHGLTFIVLILLLPAFLWDTARLTHRFSGPVLRLRRMMKELAAGEDPGELRFRDGDFWKELGDHFNGIRARLVQAGELCEASSAVAANDPKASNGSH